MSSLTLLGTGTCQIEYERRASSVLLELDGTYVLFDCGHGVVQRLLDVGVQHNQVNHVVLSHFHPDHVSDLVPFLQAGAWSKRNPRTSDIHIYGPHGVQRVVDGLVDVFGRNSFQQPSYSVVVHELDEERFSIGSHAFDFVSLPPAGNHGLRFRSRGKRYAITGDSYFHAEEIAFLQILDARTYFDDLAHKFVPDDVALFHRGDVAIIKVYIGTTDRRSRNFDNGITRIDQHGVGHVVDPYLVSTIPAECFHHKLSLLSTLACRLSLNGGNFARLHQFFKSA